mmetsp:Transcript_48395/g.75569  ORF Transcript_48395/g.75569 Transcript_48395/m.75569 type:complete len:81 (-) Transcript_48395:2-244(-)
MPAPLLRLVLLSGVRWFWGARAPGGRGAELPDFCKILGTASHRVELRALRAQWLRGCVSAPAGSLKWAAGDCFALQPLAA